MLFTKKLAFDRLKKNPPSSHSNKETENCRLFERYIFLIKEKCIFAFFPEANQLPFNGFFGFLRKLMGIIDFFTVLPYTHIVNGRHSVI